MVSPALPGPPGPLRDAAPAALLGRWADRLWAGTQFAAAAQPTLPTGYPALDAQLPGGGWPASGLTELLFDAPGSGEWRLLAPALRAQAALRPVVCVAPPLQPYAPALRGLSLPLQRFVWVTPPDPADAAWALEQGCWLLALRPPAARGQSSPAPLRLACRAAAGGRLAIDVFKRRGPAQAAPLLLQLPPVAAPSTDTPPHAVARPASAVAAA